MLFGYKTLRIDCVGWMLLFTFVVFLHQTSNFVFKPFTLSFFKLSMCRVLQPSKIKSIILNSLSCRRWINIFRVNYWPLVLFSCWYYFSLFVVFEATHLCHHIRLGNLFLSLKTQDSFSQEELLPASLLGCMTPFAGGHAAGVLRLSDTWVSREASLIPGSLCVLGL